MKEEEKILEKYGWTILCESPFEIENTEGSFASGIAAKMILESILKQEKRNKNDNKN